jgi:hypothetical protein
VNCAALRYPVAAAPGILRPYRPYRIGFPFREDMFHVITNLAAMAEALSLSADYRLLRRLVPRMQSAPAAGQETRVGILIDNTPTVSQF